MGNGAKWSVGAELIVCGKDTGHQSGGKILIALENVDCCFGDGQVFGGVGSYDAALRMVVDKNNVQQTAYFWHSSSSRLIEKPKGRGANWVGYPGYGWLFLWADERIGGGSKEELKEEPKEEPAPTAFLRSLSSSLVAMISPKDAPLSSPVAQFGGRWALYMVNGPEQHKDALRLGANASGCGDLASNPASGAHKMSEASFDSKRFTEVLAVGSDGSWAHIERADGQPIPASDAFRVGAAHGYRLRFSNGVSKDSPGNDPWGAQANHGPFFVDVDIVQGQEGGQWMWCDAEFDPRRLRMGKILGTKGACFADENGGFVWRWFGRAASEQEAAPIVEGFILEPPVAIAEPVAVETIHLAGPSSSSAPPPLIEVVNLLKKELGITGNIHEVLTQACEQLGLDRTGKSLTEQAAACWRLVASA